MTLGSRRRKYFENSDDEKHVRDNRTLTKDIAMVILTRNKIMSIMVLEKICRVRV